MKVNALRKRVAIYPELLGVGGTSLMTATITQNKTVSWKFC